MLFWKIFVCVILLVGILWSSWYMAKHTYGPD